VILEVGGAAVVVWRNTKNTGNEAGSDQLKPRLGTCELLAWDSEAFNIRNTYDATLKGGNARAKRFDACFCCDEGKRVVIFTLVSSECAISEKRQYLLPGLKFPPY
jgi:hypothetical protein